MTTSTRPGSPRHGPLVRFRYHLDNALTRSHSFAIFILAATLALALVMAAIQAFVAGIAVLAAPSHPDASHFEAFWSSFSKILSLKEQPTWGERIVATLYWAIGITVSGTVIGFITSRMQGAISALRQGRTPIIHSGHTLILGWSPRMPALVQELAEAGRNRHRPTVVIFADKDREWMLQEIESHVVDRGPLRIITRRGDPTNPRDLIRANVPGARSVIILDSEASGDATAVASVLATCAIAPTCEVPVVVEIDDAGTASALAASMRGRVRPVRSHDLIARVTAQASRQAGLGAVMLDLLNFSGEEIYFAAAPGLEGRAYGEVLRSFPEACPIGWLEPDGTPRLNPPADARMPSPPRVVVIATDDDRAVPTAVPFEPRHLVAETSRAGAASPERILIIGWSSMGVAVLRSLAPFLPAGSSVLVAARADLAGPEAPPEDASPAGVSIRRIDFSGEVEHLHRMLLDERFDEIIVLGYRHGIPVAEADAQTMLTLMLLGDVLSREPASLRGTRIVGEILDSRRVELASLSGADDLVVSDRLAGSMIAQLAENPELGRIFADLFDPQGATITLRPVTEFATTGDTVRFGDLVHMASGRGDSAVGYRVARAADGKPSVRLNPRKGDVFTVGRDDRLIVIGSLQ